VQLNPSAVSGVQNKFDAVVDPTPNDDDTLGFEVGSLFINVVLNTAFINVDAMTGAAIWDAINQNNIDGGSFNDLYLNTGNVDGGSF